MRFVASLLAGALLPLAIGLPELEPDRRVLPQPNGYDALVRAGQQAQRSSGGEEALAAPEGASLIDLRRSLLHVRSALIQARGALRLAAARPTVRIDDEPDWSFLAALFAAEGRVAFAEKRKAPALDHFLDAVELGTRVGKGGGLSPHHAGMDCIIIGGEGAERCVAGLSAEEAAAAGARLERVIDQLPSYAEAIAQQRRQELEDVRQSLSAPTPELKPGLTREQAFDNADRYLNRVGAMSRQPFWERKPVPVPDTKEVGAYLISYELLGVRWVLTEGRLRLLSVEMALQEYRARKGRYPEGLSDLPAAVARYTTDPCNGKPFVYRLSAERYVLYSIGPDGVDEQGKTVAGDGRGQIPGGDIPAGSLWPAQPQPRRFPVWPVVEPEEFVRGWAPSKTPVLFKKLPPGQ